MKRAIYLVPASTSLAALTPEQRAAIASVHSQFVLPQPGTGEHDGRVIVDGITGDNFDPDVLPDLGLGDWILLGLHQWDGVAPGVTVLVAIDMDIYMQFVPDVIEYDAEGEPVSSHPAPRQLAHSWAGWPVA